MLGLPASNLANAEIIPLPPVDKMAVLSGAMLMREVEAARVRATEAAGASSAAGAARSSTQPATLGVPQRADVTDDMD
jgi:hypothetical protein